MSANENTTEHNKKEMLKALAKTLGVVTNACKLAKVGRTVYYDWLKTDADFKNAVNDIDHLALDFVESKLYQQIDEGNVTATIFYLKTKGKNRGYIERQEITGVNGAPLSVSIEVIRNESDSEY